MSYYEHDDYEPSEEDYCVMEGHHPYPDEQDPDAWQTCRCRTIVFPPSSEPHDEYSAYHFELREKYLDIVLSRNIYNGAVHRTPLDMARNALTFHRDLMELSIDSMLDLLAATMSSNPFLIAPENNPREVIAVGTHLDANGHSIISDVVDEITGAKEDFWRKAKYTEGLTDPEHLRQVRLIAKFYSLLDVIPDSNSNDFKSISWHSKHETKSFIFAVYPLLVEKPAKLKSLAALVNANGISHATTGLALALLNDEIRTSAPILSSGLL